jgi:predicted nucleic acid-binding protein
MDLESAELTRAAFGLDISFIVPDLLYAEELRSRHEHLKDMGLVVTPLSEGDMRQVERMRNKHRRPGFYDITALVLAKREACPLLTGDRHLREAGEAEGVEVRGTPWLILELVEKKIVTKGDARQAFVRMKQLGRRLPWDQIEKHFGSLGDF